MLNTQEHKQYKEYTRNRLNRIKLYVKLDFFVLATGIKKNTLYTLTQQQDKSMSKEKLDKINNIIDQLERIMNSNV